MPDPLFPVITVHCFWAWCKHAERGLNPIEVHDLMEAHYTAVHTAGIQAITGPVRVTVIPGAYWEIQ